MKKLMAVVALLLCGTAGAYAADPVEKWCSDGFDKPAVFEGNPEGSGGWLLTIGGVKTEVFDDESEGFHFRTLMADQGMEDLPQADIVIIYDRVFWPCSSAGRSTGMPHNY
jgi:hypothetical protein